MAQNTLPKTPINRAIEKEKKPLPASIPAVARISSLGIIIITASNTIPRNIPKYPRLVIREVIYESMQSPLLKYMLKNLNIMYNISK